MEDQGKRILMFVVAAAAIFFAWQWLFPPPKPEPKKVVVPGEVQPSVSSPVGKPLAGGPAEAPGPAAAEELTVMQTKGVRVTFSNIGGVVKEWTVLEDPVKGRLMNEHLFIGELPGVGLGATNFTGSTTVIPMTAAWQTEKLSERKVRFRYTSKTIDVVKDLELFPDDYVVKMTVEVSLPQGGPAEATQQLAVSLFGHAPAESGGGRRGKVPTGATCHINGSVSTVSGKDLHRKGPRERAGAIRWVGLAHRYDMIALAPKPTQDENLACNAYPLDGVKDGVQVDLVFQPAKLKAGDPPIRREMVLYVGPKYLDRLEGADKVAGFSTGFRDVIDFGWFSFLSKPMLWLLHRLYDLVGNWGIAIILLTVLVKLATLYWTTKSMRSMKAMAALRPEIEALQKKYPDDKQKQQQAQMDLFKQHGVSPIAGCLPMLLQMPIWLALYKMLSVAGELHQAVFIPGWLNDLTARDPYFIVPVTLTGLMFVQSRIQPATTDNMQQKVLMYGMPLMFGVMGLYFPSGLGVYMLTNTMLGVMHSLYMKRTDKTKKPAVAPAGGAGGAAKGAPKAAELPRAEVVSGGAGKDSDLADDSDDGDDDDDGDDSDKPAAQAGKGNGVRRSQRGKRRGKRR